MSTPLWIYFTILLLTSISFGLGTDIFENNDVDILEDAFQLQRMKRETIEYEGSACPETDTQTCDFVDDECKCECKPQYNIPGCFKGKQFGGQVTFLVEGNISKIDAELSITEMFQDGEYFVKASVYSISTAATQKVTYTSGSEATYQLTYRDARAVNNSYIRNRFESNYNCIGNETVANLTVDLSKTCDTYLDETGEILCDGTFNETCDRSSSSCSVTEFGNVECACLNNFYQIDFTTCAAQFCIENPKCNYPFGWCSTVDGINTCTCMWGFDGSNCLESWLFTLTVVASGSALIILILLISVIRCAGKNKKLKKQPKPDKVETRDEEDVRPAYKLGGYQPGLMRARLPNSSYNPSRNPSDFNLGPTGAGNGHSNNAFDTSMHSTTTFNSPRKPQYSRGPADYF